MCYDSICPFAKKSCKWHFFILCKTLVFLFPPFLNIGAQVRCPQNWYIDLKPVLDQPLTNGIFVQFLPETAEFL